MPGMEIMMTCSVAVGRLSWESPQDALLKTLSDGGLLNDSFAGRRYGRLPKKARDAVDAAIEQIEDRRDVASYYD
jgi:hypothetical protein